MHSVSTYQFVLFEIFNIKSVFSTTDESCLHVSSSSSNFSWKYLWPCIDASAVQPRPPANYACLGLRAASCFMQKLSVGCGQLSD